MEEKIKNLEIQIDKNKMQSDLEMNKIKAEMDEMKVKMNEMKSEMNDMKSEMYKIKMNEEPLTMTMLAAATPQDQKQMLGEKLFPRIRRKYPDLAGKVTGILLEKENKEILKMIEKPDYLTTSVKAVINMLTKNK